MNDNSNFGCKNLLFIICTRPDCKLVWSIYFLLFTIGFCTISLDFAAWKSKSSRISCLTTFFERLTRTRQIAGRIRFWTSKYVKMNLDLTYHLRILGLAKRDHQTSFYIKRLLNHFKFLFQKLMFLVKPFWIDDALWFFRRVKGLEPHHINVDFLLV